MKLLFKKTKTLEIRGRRLKPGHYWLGCQGVIRGEAVFGDAVHIPDKDTWIKLMEQHCVKMEGLPYKTTYGHPVLCCNKVKPVPYEHPRGAVGIVVFRGQEEK